MLILPLHPVNAVVIWGGEDEFWNGRGAGTPHGKLRLISARHPALTLHNHRCAIALFVCAYNFCKVHGTLGCIPAVAVKLAGETWTIEKLLETI